MIYESKIIEFSKFIEMDFPFFRNFKKINDKVIVLQGVGLAPHKGKIPDNQINQFFEKIKNYEVIILSDSEQIWIDNWLYFLKLLVDNNKIIIMTTFTIGIKNYIDTLFPNNKIYFNTLESLLGRCLKDFDFNKKPDFSKNRKYLLKFFSYNRSPYRDYVFDFLIKNNLIDGNNLSFHNYPFTELKDMLDLQFYNSAYHLDNTKNLLKNVDLKKLNNLRIIPQSENFDIQNQYEQFNKNTIASEESYFEIISEAQMPSSKEPTDSFYYTYSITKRTTTPIFSGNVFHIMPESKFFNDELKSIGIKFYFENDFDFLKNLNQDFYFDKNTQNLLKENYEVFYSIHKKHDEQKNFIFDTLNKIYPIM